MICCLKPSLGLRLRRLLSIHVHIALLKDRDPMKGHFYLSQLIKDKTGAKIAISPFCKYIIKHIKYLINGYLAWTDITETVSWLDRIVSLFIVIFHRIYSLKYNKMI